MNELSDGNWVLSQYCMCACVCACVCGSINCLLSVSLRTGSLVVGKVLLKRFSLVRFVSLAAVVLAVFAVSFGPFVVMVSNSE